MKKLEFETSKGKFLLVDGVGEDFAMDMTHAVISDEWFINLSDIPEEKASDVVESALDSHFIEWCKNYGDNEEWEDEFIFMTAIESLHSLIKSKGWYLFDNPIDAWDIEKEFEWEQAEQKTLYNPYLFRVKNHIK